MNTMAPLPDHYCMDSKRRHQPKMAALVSGTVWLHFVTEGGSEDVVAILVVGQLVHVSIKRGHFSSCSGTFNHIPEHLSVLL